MKRRTLLATVGTVATATLAGCSSGLSEDDYDIGMTANQFRPASYTASVGETVVWGNPSSRGHSVTAYEDGLPEGADFFASGGADTESAARDGFWGSSQGRLASGDLYEHTFEVAGEYPYFCVPHEDGGMVATVVVE
ncbi:plastocyanin/azurin family copper-binding protein [Halosegnis rubeus]|uniref:Halocyanin n=1 Tax=Halosegnis rubeus TaxID=2212850 RepID=A0A5N5UHF6_9EURY|nr:plastocyanin/azurin family copper-binding protein [Halosegnis rubeus]KAB7518144.1 halocyanin [Halosegnis rubeus]